MVADGGAGLVAMGAVRHGFAQAPGSIAGRRVIGEWRRR